MAGLGTVTALNREFLGEIARTEGFAMALGAVPLLWLELLVAGLGAAVGVAGYVLGRRY